MNFTHDRIRQMEAEMARFENEISGPRSMNMMRPPMARFGPATSLRFIPHALRNTRPQYAPPMSLGSQMMGHHHPGMFQHHHPRPPQQQIQTQPTSAVIEAAPTRYLPPSANQMMQSMSVPPMISAPPLPPAVDIELAKKKMAAERAGIPTGSANAAASIPTKQSTSARSQEDAGKAFTMKTPQAPSTSRGAGAKFQKPKRYIRTAGGDTWEDSSLMEWDPSDFRLFCGDLGNEVSDELLAKAFRKYPSFQKAKVVREKRTNKTKGYGFVSFKDPQDFIRALREMDGKYVGNRPIKLRKSTWRDRNLNSVRKKMKEKRKLGMK